ncbi:MAG: GH1 family beta-glucosidase [Actinomycetota bacterium]
MNLTIAPELTTQPSTALGARFPEDFVWGVATSAAQIEGAVHADGRGESIWDRFARRPGAIADGTTPEVACDHYHRMEGDVALMAELGIRAYRFSIAWPRVIPDGDGAVNEAGLDFYDRVVDTCLAHGIEPFPTLYHWDLPQALEDRGGWLDRGVTDAFCRFTSAAVRRLGDRVGTWCTLNEPFVSATHGYWEGTHAPGRTSLRESVTAAHHLLLAHGRAVPVIRAAAPDARVGVVLNFTPVTARSSDRDDLDETRFTDDFENRWYVDPIAGAGYPEWTVERLGWDRSEVLDGDMETIAAPIDLLGVNYYARQLVHAGDDTRDPILPTTGMGWEIYPQGLRETLVRIHTEHGFPSYAITENGSAFDDVPDAAGEVDDQDRVSYLADHLVELREAMDEGVPVEGYFAWSFLDNFEWAYGYEKRFGIVRVDYETQERTPKASARFYSDIIRSGAVERR